MTALVLAWCSVTPSGALSCLHCFLGQRWVEATVNDRSRQSEWAESRVDRVSRTPIHGASGQAPSLDSMSRLAQALSQSGDVQEPVVARPPWREPFASTFPQGLLPCGTATVQFSSALHSHLAGLRAPPPLIET